MAGSDLRLWHGKQEGFEADEDGARNSPTSFTKPVIIPPPMRAGRSVCP
jgi:hypothetical protein